VRQLIDDPSGRLWETANLDLLAEGCIDELWGELLDSFPWLRSTLTAALTPVTPGYVDTATALTRLYRIQQVIRDGVEYSPVDQKDVLVSATEALETPPQSYTFLGTQIHLFPYAMSSVYVRYSSLPEPFTSITPGPDPDDPTDDDASFIEWPDGYHMAYVYDIAAKAIEKGDREESAKLQSRAELSLFRLKAYLRKQHAGVVIARIHDDPIAWGGV
jgi:hypothetical protein